MSVQNHQSNRQAWAGRIKAIVGNRKRGWDTVGIPILTGAIFVTDILTPRGICDWAWYFVPLLLSAGISIRFSPYLLTAIFSALIVLGGFLSPQEVQPIMLTMVSRCIGILLLWLVARLVSQYHQKFAKANQLSCVVEQSPVSIIITDVTGAIEYVNPKFSALTGYTKGEVLGKNPRLLKSGEMPAGEYQRLWQDITQGQEWRGLFHNRKKNGELFWEAALISPLRNVDGTITHFLAIKEDITDRKLAEEQLKASSEELKLTHAKLHFTLEHNPAVVYTLKIKGQKIIPVTVSGSIERLLGFAATEAARYEWWLENLHPEDRDRVVKIFSQALTQQGYLMEYRLRHKNGTYLWVEDHSQVVCDADGKPDYLVGVWMDISERKRTEEELRWKTALLEAQVHSALDGLLVVDGEGKDILQNQRMLELWKLPPHIAENKSDADRLRFAAKQTKHPQQFMEKIAYLYSHPDEVSRDEIDLIDGTVLDRYSSPVRDKAGKYFGRIWVFRDITEHRLAEEKLSVSEARYRLISENVADVICRLDPITGKLSYLSPSVHGLLGYTLEEALAKTMTEFLMPDSQKKSAELLAVRIPHFQALPFGKISFQDEMDAKHKNGSSIPVEISSTFMRNELGELDIIAIVRDITERKQMELVLQAEREQLEREFLRRIEMEQERIGRDLHDGLCQVLVGAKYRSALLEKMLNNEDLPAAAGEAKCIEQLLNKTIQQARDLAKGLNPVPQVANGLVYALEELAKDVGTTSPTRCRCQFSLATPISDQYVVNHLYRITQEAVQNAVKHGKAQNILILLKEQIGNFVLTIEDDGEGFSGGFENFGGAGLHNIKTRAGMIGGTLTIQNGRHGGCVVNLNLPATAKQVQS